MGCFLMSFNEIDEDVVGKRVLVEKVVMPDLGTDNWNAR